MNIKTFATTDGENALDVGSTKAKYYWCKNVGQTALYVSDNANVKADGDGVALLNVGEAVMIENYDNFIYVLNAGKIEVYETENETCPFELPSVSPLDLQTAAECGAVKAQVGELKSDLTTLNDRFYSTFLSKCKIVHGKNVNKSTSYSIVSDDNSYLLLIPQSEYVYLSIDRTQIANSSCAVVFTNENLSQISGMVINEYNCVTRRNPEQYQYVAIPYANNTIPNIKPMITNVDRDEIKYDYISDRVKITNDKLNLINIQYSFIDYRLMYGLVYPANGYVVSNVFPVDVSAVYYFNGYYNNNSGMVLALLDETFNVIGSVNLNTSNVLLESKCFNYLNIGISKVSYVDLNSVITDELLKNAKYAFISMNYAYNTGFDVNNLFFSKDYPLNSLQPANKYQINNEHAVSLSNSYSGKYFAGIGDSITAQGFYLEYVRNALNLNGYVCNGVGGTRISGDNEKAMWQDVRINAVLDVDLITICGGVNDCGQSAAIGDISKENCDTNTFVGAYNVLISKLYYRFLDIQSGYYSTIDYSGVSKLINPKNIAIVLMTPPKFFDNEKAYTSEYLYADAVKAIGELWGLPVIDLYSECNINDMNKTLYYPESDRTHPSTEGHKMFANLIVGKLKQLNIFGTN